jgi:hypothetical protein
MVGPSQWSRSASAGGIPAWWSRRRNWSITTLTCTHAPPRLSRPASTGQAGHPQAGNRRAQMRGEVGSFAVLLQHPCV